VRSRTGAKTKTPSTAAQACFVASFPVLPLTRSALQQGCLSTRRHSVGAERIATSGFEGMLRRTQSGSCKVPLRSSSRRSAASLASLRYTVYVSRRSCAARSFGTVSHAV
jgi:hypothetical protein